MATAQLVDAAPSTALALRAEEPSGSIAAFASPSNYEAAKRIATALSQSTVVPKQYQGPSGVANCLVALEVASRIGMSVLAVMQSLNVISGRPGWASTFLIGCVNKSKRFSPLRFEIAGGDDPKADSYRCRAVAKDLDSDEVLRGTWITWPMVKGEGWFGREGSKWKTMPEQMFMYRSAAFWTRVYAPEISLGMQTAEEVEDITDRRTSAGGAAEINAALATIPASTAMPTSVSPAEVEHDLSDLVEEAPCPECGGTDDMHELTCSKYVD